MKSTKRTLEIVLAISFSVIILVIFVSVGRTRTDKATVKKDVCIYYDVVNVRSSPTIKKSNTIGQLRRGTTVTLTGRQSGFDSEPHFAGDYWVEIYYDESDSGTAWICYDSIDHWEGV